MYRKHLILFSMIVSLLALTACNTPETKADKKEQAITIYLVRHGKTFFNTTGQSQGWSDTPLTDLGIEQAQMVGKSMKDIRFVASYSSDLGRQRHTANLILSKNENKLPALKEHIGFREWFYGGFEGNTDEHMMNVIEEKTGITEWEKVTADDIAKVDELGQAETTKDIETRGKKAIEQVIQEAKDAGGGNVLVVSSGGMIPSLLEILAPNEYAGQRIANCSVTILKQTKDKFTIEAIGDTSYVEGK